MWHVLHTHDYTTAHADLHPAETIKISNDLSYQHYSVQFWQCPWPFAQLRQQVSNCLPFDGLTLRPQPILQVLIEPLDETVEACRISPEFLELMVLVVPTVPSVAILVNSSAGVATLLVLSITSAVLARDLEPAPQSGL